MSFFGARPLKDKSVPAHAPWVEKYRPKTLDDVSAQEHTVTILKRTLSSSNLPHMLFYGPPGTGKTSTILALARSLFGPELMKTRVLELNASDERGISIVREKIRNFARLVVSKPSAHARENYPCPPYKIIILDEADSMTADAQSALRRTMENYSTITRFCLICNYVTRIIDPLASRCSKFRFKPLDQSNSLDRLKYIAAQESVSYNEEALVRLLDASEGDLRKAITLLQSAAKLHAPDIVGNGGSEITVETVDEISGTVPDNLIDSIISEIMSARSSNLSTAVSDLQKSVRDIMLSGWSGIQIVSQVHDGLMTNETIPLAQKSAISLVLSETDKYLTDGSNEHIQVLSMAVRIAEIIAR